MNLERKDDVDPICTACTTPLKTLWYKELSNFLGKRYGYFCPHCQRILGVSHRKGFWMG